MCFFSFCCVGLYFSFFCQRTYNTLHSEHAEGIRKERGKKKILSCHFVYSFLELVSVRLMVSLTKAMFLLKKKIEKKRKRNLLTKYSINYNPKCVSLAGCSTRQSIVCRQIAWVSPFPKMEPLHADFYTYLTIA